MSAAMTRHNRKTGFRPYGNWTRISSSLLWLLAVLWINPLMAANDRTEKFERGGFTKKVSKVSGKATGSVELTDTQEGKVVDHVIESEIEFNQVPTAQSPDACHAELAISYVRLGDQVEVETTVRVNDCTRSEGSYSIGVRSTLQNGEVARDNYHETWSQGIAGDLVLIANYPLPPASRLSGVSIKSDPRPCTCSIESTP
jgi:hypothetical protein